LRNPLGVIKNSVYFLRMTTPEDERVRRHLNILEREVGTSDRIVTDLLDFAREPSARVMPTNLNRVVQEYFAQWPPPDAIELQLGLGEGVRAVPVDAAHLGIILGNLARNAAQAMPEGGRLI